MTLHQRTGEADKLRVRQFIHSGRIGGVETSVARLRAASYADVQYRVATLAPRAEDTTDLALPAPDYSGNGENNPLSYFRLALWAKRERADVVVASLWRSVIAGIITKCIHPRVTFIVFLHSTKYKNIADRIAHVVGIWVADSVLCDSAATRSALLGRGNHGNVQIIPPIRRREQLCRVARPDSVIRLIYWGRLAREKRLDRTLALLSELHRISPVPIVCTIIGPDYGEYETLKADADSRGLTDVVVWHGSASWDDIERQASGCTFFVQLSEFEGLGMAAVEAMQLGLIPVITAVGQVPEFTADGVNALHFSQPRETASRILDVWQHPVRARTMSQAATRQWDSVGDFEELFASTCLRARGVEPAGSTLMVRDHD